MAQGMAYIDVDMSATAKASSGTILMHILND